MATVEIQVPDIGDFDEVTVIELMVKVGDTVKADQSLITVESDKASMEIPSSHAGVVSAFKVKLGDKVKQGSIVLTLEAAGAASAPNQAAATAAPAQAATVSVASTTPIAAPVAAAAPVASGPLQVFVPDIGDFKDVIVIELMVKPGDTIKADQSMVTVESDKASMEIPSSHAGVLKELKVKIGDKVNIGDLLAVLEGVAGAAVAVAAPSAPSAPVAAAASVAAPVAVAAVAAAPAHAPGGTTLGLPHASPSVRKFARELGVPLDELKGSGTKGRITQDD
ncbi:MAG: Dihydrolipoyllysine-residue acetyltransferase component of pyruvate dehydrogenase complex, partial [Pseudomonadota bacterium]